MSIIFCNFASDLKITIMASPVLKKCYTPEEKAAIANAQAMSAQSAQYAMGIAYNTKRCPECQAICLNAPVNCPYCGADLKGVKPLTPKELEELSE